MDIRITYLDTELMLVIRRKEINIQLEEGMMEYEKVARQILEGGTYNDPYDHLGSAFQGQLPHSVIIQETVVIHAVRYYMEIFTGHIDG